MRLLFLGSAGAKYYCTTRVTVSCCDTVPHVAVTCTLYEPGGVPGCPPPPPSLNPPPQAESMKAAKNSTRPTGIRARFAAPLRDRPEARITRNGKDSAYKTTPVSIPSIAVGAVVAILSVTVVAPEPAAMVAGANTQRESGGKLDDAQVNVTLLANEPPLGVMLNE